MNGYPKQMEPPAIQKVHNLCCDLSRSTYTLWYVCHFAPLISHVVRFKQVGR